MAPPNPFAVSRHPSRQPESPAQKREVLSADNYPELKLRAEPLPVVEERTPEAPKAEDEELCRQVEEGEFQELAPKECQRLLSKLLDLGRVSVFSHGAERLMMALESDRAETRRWSLETIYALAADENQALIPFGTFPLFLGGVGRCLAAETQSTERAFAVDCVALLVGAVATSGDLEGARNHLARIIRDAGDAGSELRTQIVSSASLSIAPLRLFFQEGHAVLDSRVLPFYQMAGPEGVRGLIHHLGEEESRQRRSRILEILRALAPLSFQPVKESLESGVWYLIRNALNLLSELGEPESFDSTLPFLEHSDTRIRRAAIRACWKTGGSRAEPLLLGLLAQCDDEAQEEILVGLGQIHALSAVGRIADLASRVEEPLRLKCIETLGQLGQPGSIPLLVKFLEQKGRVFKTRETASIREASAKALVAIGTPEALAALAMAVREAPRHGDQEVLRKILEQPLWR